MGPAADDQQLMGPAVDHEQLMSLLTSDSFSAQSMFEAQLQLHRDAGDHMGQYATPHLSHQQQQQQQQQAADDFVPGRRPTLGDTVGLSDSFRRLRMGEWRPAPPLQRAQALPPVIWP
jgi:hypothetical protein